MYLNLDDGQSLFFSQELEHVLSRIHNVEYPELKARMFIPVNGEAGGGSDSFSYYQFSSTGIAKLISDYADDLPRADAMGQKFTAPIEPLGISFGYSLGEVRAAAKVGRPLTTAKADAARLGHEQAVDEIAAFGDATTGITGFLNNANVPQASAVTGSWTPATDPDLILGDMNESVASIISITKATESPDTILLPIEKFALINQMRLGDTNTTVLDFFLKNNTWISGVDHWHRLEGAGAVGADRMMTYRRDPSKVELHIPSEFEALPVQERGLAFVVPTYSTIGGTTFYKPLSAKYTDGI